MSSHQELSLSTITLPMYLGFYDWERVSPQPISFDISFSFSLDNNYVDGSMQQTVNYEDIIAFLKKMPSYTHFLTIESVAEFVCSHLLSIPRISECRVRVSKYKVCDKFCDVSYTLTQSNA